MKKIQKTKMHEAYATSKFSKACRELHVNAKQKDYSSKSILEDLPSNEQMLCSNAYSEILKVLKFLG
jgi:hypothetical protein